MKCERFQESMMLAAYSELPDEEAIMLEQHLAGCDACRHELAEMQEMFQLLALVPVVDPSPNMLAQSRVRLDEALDQIPAHGFVARLRINFFRWVGNVQSAPALATLLVGLGFLAGNFTYRYQVAHAPAAITITNATNSTIQNVSGIVRTTDPNVVQVLYNRVVPESVQGSPNDPTIRGFLMLGARLAATNGVRNDSVELLADECRSGQGCVADSTGKDPRITLMTSLRFDSNIGVRLKALNGLQPYVTQDRRVRDAVSEALMLDPSEQVRREAVDLLEPVVSDSSVRRVLHTVSTSDDNPYIRNVSFQALKGEDSIQ